MEIELNRYEKVNICIKVCSECDKQFKKYKNSKKGKKRFFARPHNSLTCSPKCSKIRIRRLIKIEGQKNKYKRCLKNKS